ncbi:MAG TPA: hypothetical protein VFQ35_15245 [Polyangiaceae bacterium]|nr:hypothetical protein [Polyangiaceae bacterium]
MVIDWTAGIGGMGAGGATSASGGMVSVGGAVASSNTVEIDWADVLPSTEAACMDSFLAAYHFADNGSGSWVAVDFASANGTWRAPWCVGPSVVFSDIAPRARIAVTARSKQASTAPTRAFFIGFSPP